jgi:surfeit locus 1 family protein
MTPRTVVATLLVLLAVATMVALGFWQLDRRDQKNGLLARYAANRNLPTMAYPAIPVGEDLLFRKAAAHCLEPVSEVVVAGYDVGGERGWRHIISCRTGAEGPGLVVDIGWSTDFARRSSWRGGEVVGVIGPLPDQRSVIARALSGPQAQALLLVATQPAAGLKPSAPPSMDAIPNNHLAYAVQWFVFAAIALVIFLIALKKRTRS